ncbi:S-adenosylmethionine synthetase [Bradyrhizobium yuanmingense]
MSLEAAAGKNPVSHVGKIYNLLAARVAEALVAELPGVNEAHCFMVSKIGAPVSEPALVQVKLRIEEGLPEEQREPTYGIVADRLARVPELIDEVMAGRMMVF